MKISSQPYKIIAQYLFIFLVIKSTKSQQSQYKYFNYIESTPSLVADIKTYDDGTILVHIIRNDSTQLTDCKKIRGISLEQKLHIRVIYLNGSVKEIDPNLNLHPVNYCLLNSDNTEYKINRLNNIVTYLKDTQKNNASILHNTINPISIYPLQKPFILVTYVKTTNSSNLTTYEEWADVIDWDGNSRSTNFLGVWVNSTIQLNINKKLGFLRFASDETHWRWQQFSIDDSGTLTSGNLTYMKKTDNITNYRYSDSPIAIISTVDNGYIVVAVFNDTLERNNSDSLFPHYGGLYALLIPYNSQYTGNDIYQITQPNTTINSVYCDTADIYIMCVFSVNSDITTNYGTIIFDSSGTVLSRKVISDLPNVIGLPQQGWSAKIMPFGGFILGLTAYDDIDNEIYHHIYAYNFNDSQVPLKSPGPFLTNYLGVNAITSNNTFLLASPYTIDNTSWSLLTIPLPSVLKQDFGYDNVNIKKTIPSINTTVNSSTTILNITFAYNIALSTGNITIYKASDNSIRQRVSATMHEFCKINPKDGYTVSITVINSTFNENGEQYFVTMDDNFVKRVQTNEPLKGIHDGIWILKSDNQKIYSDESIMGSVCLTIDASKRFLKHNNQSEYIDTLLNELAYKVPINRSRLSTNNNFQEVFNGQIAIPIRIEMTNNEVERSSSDVFSDLNRMIVYKNITTFSSGMTNDLDQDYGFKFIEIIRNYWSEYKMPIIIGIIVIVICIALYSLSHALNYKLNSKLKSICLERISFAVNILGLIIPNFILSGLFVIDNSNDVPMLCWPSILVLWVPPLIKFCITIGAICKGISDPMICENFKKLVKEHRGLVVMFIILTMTDYVYLIILKDIHKSFYRYTITKQALPDIPENIEEIIQTLSKQKVFFTFPIQNQPDITPTMKIYEQVNKFNILKYKLEYKLEVVIIFGAFFDIIFRDIPQIIIQVSYYNSKLILVYHWVPLLLLIASSLKIFMTICYFVCKRITLCLILRYSCDFYGTCTRCKRPNTSPTWCKFCDTSEATEELASGNRNIDKCITDVQKEVIRYEKIIEWIPFNELDNLQMIREDKSETIFMATWLDGVRTIVKNEHAEYTRSRINSYGVNLKILHDFQTCDLFINEFTNYMEREENVVYGITQNTETNQYIIVIPDEFNSRRNDSNGICIHCGHCNTSPAWCQSCDPWKAAQECTCGNEVIDNFIKEFQFKVTEYEKVIEWIPFDKLINLQEIKEESNLAFMATWTKGVRTIKSESGKYTQSRTMSSVDLMKLNYSQMNTIELLENFENHIQSDKYRIHGITRTTETGQYMLVIDFYNYKRKLVNRICEHCNRYNTSPAWCQLCDPPRVVQNTSGDKDIDNCITEFQLKATTYENVIEWIPYNRLGDIKEIGRGGFSTVYSSIWLDGKRMVENHVRYRKKCDVALKTLHGSQTSSSEFLNEFKNHMECRLEGSALEVYGLTQKTENGQYMMVYQYANRGNLHDFLTKNFRELVWQKKLKQLADITHDLSRIHKAKLIHNDFHSSNILVNQDIDGNIKSYITDLGLSRKKDENGSKKVVYGVIPYIAPEVLQGCQHTQEAADIYGLGIIMTEITTGKRAYDGSNLDPELLILKIRSGLRPELAEGTPDCYIDLAKRCVDSNPQKRPTAEYVHSKINQWKTILESENLTEEELDIEEKFINADSIIKQTSLESLSMLQNKYYGTLIEITNLKGSRSISSDMGSDFCYVINIYNSDWL